MYAFSVLREVKDMATEKQLDDVTSHCQACSGDEVTNVASLYCVECQIKFCSQCERVHKAIKLTSTHRLVLVGENMDE